MHLFRLLAAGAGSLAGAVNFWRLPIYVEAEPPLEIGEKRVYTFLFVSLFGLCAISNFTEVWGTPIHTAFDFGIKMWLWPSMLAFVLSLPSLFRFVHHAEAPPAA